MTKPILVKKSGWGWCIVWAVALSGNTTRAPYWRHSRFSILLSRIIAVLSQMQNAFIKFALSAKFWRALRDPKAVYLPLSARCRTLCRPCACNCESCGYAFDKRTLMTVMAKLVEITIETFSKRRPFG
ncbi:MAG: hypothetical protein ABR97_05300 [Rhodobacter sp. BACL10 MAG-120419-bin15]|nr:MAG: hypothetical protein ABR97_05300 [Rhodobacter sp. BACL10 MAG-120419-bin15]